jgi:transcriptional regulator with XRE-family HTH domain
MSRSIIIPPLAVRRALIGLGADLRAARLRRRLPLAIVAERAMTTRQTVSRIEAGDPSVALGTWATVFALGMIERLADVADPAGDRVGMTLELERLPKRARLSRPHPRTPPRAP